jgi:hypothetical protein
MDARVKPGHDAEFFDALPLAPAPLPNAAARHIFSYMPYPFNSAPSIVRLRVLPDEPGAVVGTRPRGSHGQTSRRPHTDAQVAAVRRLIEQTALTYGEIAKRSGVGRASICRWTRDGGWQRPVFAPRATDTVPRPRAGQKLKLRLLAERLRTLAERYVRELEEAPHVDLDRLVQALEVVKMARLAAMGRKRRRRSSSSPFVPAQAGTQGPQAHEQAALDSRVRGNERGEPCDPGARAALLENLRAAGVHVERAPPAALEDFIASHAPPREEPVLRQKGRYSKRNREHARMLERDR